MTALRTRSQLWPAARPLFMTALGLFVITIVIGILNGLDIWEPGHDTLITHVHAGTLGWITLAVTGAALLMFTDGRRLTDEEVGSAQNMAWAMLGAIALYVTAFWLGDSIPGDRIQRPIAGSLLFIAIIWVLVWMFRQRRSQASTVPTMAILLSWISLLIGATFGVILGLFTARGEVPGISTDTAESLAEAHPPAMVIGFLILAAVGLIEWLLRADPAQGRNRTWGMVQVWLLFGAGVVVNVAFIIDRAKELLPPANLLQVVALVVLVVRLWPELKPSAWRGVGAAIHPRTAVVFLVLNLVVFAVLIQQIISGSFDLDDPTDANLGLVFVLDHFQFIGVMTNALFGVIALSAIGEEFDLAGKLTFWGVNLGLIVFAIGLATVNATLKQIATPVMGAALLLGIVIYVRALMAAGEPAEEPVG